jgi:glutamate synthase (ferredoxin)
MTGGTVVILGGTGRNFAAGMSGGIAFVFDEKGDFSSNCNTQMVALEPLDEKDIALLHEMVTSHQTWTGSARAAALLADWDASLTKFVKVMPQDYKRVLQALERAKAAGLSGEDALTAAFEENSHEAA